MARCIRRFVGTCSLGWERKIFRVLNWLRFYFYGFDMPSFFNSSCIKLIKILIYMGFILHLIGFNFGHDREQQLCFLPGSTSVDREGESTYTSIYYKRDEFNFHVTNFSFQSRNIPASPAYGVFVSQLIRYAQACSSYWCFILRTTRLSNKQGYVKERLK